MKKEKQLSWGEMGAYTLLLIALACLVTCGQGCNPISKATQKVITNKQAFDSVGRLYIGLHPCVKDSVVTFVPGETTILVDSVKEYVKGDTIAFFRVDTIFKTVNKWERRVDTFRASVKDLQSFELLAEDYKKLLAEDNRHQGQISQLVIRSLEDSRVIFRQKIYIWAPWVLVLIGAILYFTITKAFPILKAKNLF